MEKSGEGKSFSSREIDLVLIDFDGFTSRSVDLLDLLVDVQVRGEFIHLCGDFLQEFQVDTSVLDLAELSR